MNNKKNTIYTKNQINIATFFGGPLIAGYLLSQNFKTFGNREAAKKSIIYSTLGLSLIIIFFSILPMFVGFEVPSSSIAIIPILITSFVSKKYQSQKIEKYKKLGHKTASSLGVFGKSILSLIITTIIYLVLFQISTNINFKYNYAGYLKNYCTTTYKESLIRNTKLYVPEDASCFIYKKLTNKGYELIQIDHLLTVEFEYQKSIGLVNDDQEISEYNLQEYNPLPYIGENQKFGISDEQIIEILNTEDEYLKLIGVINPK